MASVLPIQLLDSLTEDRSSWNWNFDQWLLISPYVTGKSSTAKMCVAFLSSIVSSCCVACVCQQNQKTACTRCSREKLDGQYGTKKLVVAEWHCFYNYKQKEGQTLTVYLAELWKLAATCDCSAYELTENLWDKFVMAICNECLLQQLLQDHKKSLDDIQYSLRVTW